MQQDPTVFLQYPAINPPQLQFPEQEQLKCPRCDSTNTKFCYYNNYNLSQPRHFCKACRRYWTKGGSLRNVPVGGSSRKSSKRATPSSSRASSPAPKRASVDPKTEPAGGVELLPAGSSFTSLLVDDDGQLGVGSYVESIGSGQGDGLACDPVESGGGCDDDGWPDLAIFTQSPGFMQ